MACLDAFNAGDAELGTAFSGFKQSYHIAQRELPCPPGDIGHMELAFPLRGTTNQSHVELCIALLQASGKFRLVYHINLSAVDPWSRPRHLLSSSVLHGTAQSRRSYITSLAVGNHVCSISHKGIPYTLYRGGWRRSPSRWLHHTRSGGPRIPNMMIPIPEEAAPLGILFGVCCHDGLGCVGLGMF